MLTITLYIDYNETDNMNTFLADHDIRIVRFEQDDMICGGNPFYELYLDTPEKLTVFAAFYAA